MSNGEYYVDQMQRDEKLQDGNSWNGDSFDTNEGNSRYIIKAWNKQPRRSTRAPLPN